MSSHVLRTSSTENGIKVRLATADDIFFIESLIREAFVDNNVHVCEQRTIQKLLADLFESKPSWCGVLVAESGGAPLGAAAYRRGYWSWSGRTLVLIGLYVRPPARRKGLGRRLVLELCRLALAEHAQLDWLQPQDPTALRFFAQFGAHRNSTFDDHCTMKMPIDSITAATGPSGTDGTSSERRDGSDGAHNQSPQPNHSRSMMTVRQARIADMAAISDMINELAVYQEHPDGPQLSVKDLEEDGFGSSPWFFVFVAERDGVAVGMVMGNRDWDCTRRHYLQSLYVRPNARRCGIADLLIKEFCKYSLGQGVQCVDLNVANDNAPALKLYRRLRAVVVPPADVPVTYRLSRSQIKDIVLQSQL